jgi:hypothetical protein
MIPKFTERLLAAKDQISSELKELDYPSYADLFRLAIKYITDPDDYDFEFPSPDPERITQLDWGDYQGTLLYVVAACGYQPSTFYTAVVDYGSYSGCDTRQAVLEADNPDTRAELLFDLIRNMISSMHKVQGGAQFLLASSTPRYYLCIIPEEGKETLLSILNRFHVSYKEIA